MIFIARFMNSFLHQASFATGYWCYDRHRSVRLVVLVGLAIDQIAQSGLSSLSVIYYSAQLFSLNALVATADRLMYQAKQKQGRERR
ncbi:diguanylate cyclase [Klebsiella pneumoniae]|nr:diguanylate cyclase [Klebsiella pneumoniae]